MTARLLFLSAMIAVSLAVLPSTVSAQAVLETEELRLVVGTSGEVKSLFDRVHGVEYVAGDEDSALLRVRSNGRFEIPAEMHWDAQQGTMRLVYDVIGVEGIVKATVKPTHVNLELVSLDPLEKIDAVQWGPLPTTIGETVGEIVGVVRNDEYAIGLQGLNVKTLGGFFPNDEGLDTSRSQTAKATEWGSTLQAYSLDRSRPRNISVWNGNFPNMPVPPIEGETVLGSKIVLFGCAAADALKRVGQIEVAEGLPHPEFDGVWAKQSSEPGRSYLIASFSERTVDEWLGYAKRANLACLYHSGPFKSWGHYELNPRLFPNGNDGMRECVRKARKLGIRIGVHTLTNFINTNDPYVTPVPDPRLAKTGTSRLVEDINENAVEIPVASPEYFDNMKANWLRTVMVGQELIRYGAVSEKEPWKILDCQRGAFGTRAGPHAKGDEVAKLLDHPYKVFFPNYDMQHEIAIRLADLFNETGISHFDFDGHEGGWASGQGDFAVEMIAKVFYDHLERPVFNGSSVSKPFYWHINTAVNWGEPWGAGFREGMPEYRFNNQPLLERNFMPNMLGWFQMRPETTLADMEWMLARGAGYNAGFALATDARSVRKNPQTGAILDAIRIWEEAGRSRAFTDEQRERLKDPRREFHLEYQADGNEWRLYPFNLSEPLVYEEYLRQPGEPTPAKWQYVNPDEKQKLQFYLEVIGDQGSFRNPTLEFDGYMQVVIQAEIEAGQRLVCDGTRTVRIYDGKGQQLKAIDLPGSVPSISHGPHSVELAGEFLGDPTPKLILRIRTQGKPETLAAAK